MRSALEPSFSGNGRRKTLPPDLEEGVRKFLTEKLGKDFPVGYYLDKVSDRQAMLSMGQYPLICKHIIISIFMECFDEWYSIATNILRYSRIHPMDVIQDFFLIILERTLPAKPIGNLEGWIYTILKNRCIALMKAQTRKKIVEYVEHEDKRYEPSVDEIYILKDEVNFYLSKMSQSTHSGRLRRRVLLLFYICGLKHKEIAEELGISARYSRNLLVAALKDLVEISNKFNDRDRDPEDDSSSDHDPNGGGSPSYPNKPRKSPGTNDKQSKHSDQEDFTILNLKPMTNLNALEPSFDHSRSPIINFKTPGVFIPSIKKEEWPNSSVSLPNKVDNPKDITVLDLWHYINHTGYLSDITVQTITENSVFRKVLLLKLYLLRKVKPELKTVPLDFFFQTKQLLFKALEEVFKSHYEPNNGSSKDPYTYYIFYNFFKYDQSCQAISSSQDEVKQNLNLLEYLSDTLLEEALEQDNLSRQLQQETIANLDKLIDIKRQSWIAANEYLLCGLRNDSNPWLTKDLIDESPTEKTVPPDNLRITVMKGRNMERYLTSNDLLRYLRKECNVEEQRRIEALIDEHPRYRDMLEGLEILLKEQGGGSEVEAFLKEKKSAAKNFIEDLFSKHQEVLKESKTKSLTKGAFGFKFSSLLSDGLRKYSPKYETWFYHLPTNGHKPQITRFDERSLASLSCMESLSIFECLLPCLGKVQLFGHGTEFDADTPQVWNYPVNAEEDYKDLHSVLFQWDMGDLGQTIKRFLSPEGRKFSFDKLNLKIGSPFKRNNPLVIDITSLEECWSYSMAYTRPQIERCLLRSSVYIDLPDKKLNLEGNTVQFLSFKDHIKKRNSLSGILPEKQTLYFDDFDMLDKHVEIPKLCLSLKLELVLTSVYFLLCSFLVKVLVYPLSKGNTRESLFAIHISNHKDAFSCELLSKERIDAPSNSDSNFPDFIVLDDDWNRNNWNTLLIINTQKPSFMETFDHIISRFFPALTTIRSLAEGSVEVPQDYQYDHLDVNDNGLELNYLRLNQPV